MPSYNKDRWDILEFLIVHFSLSTASIKWAHFQSTSDLLCKAGDRGGVVVWESRKCTNKLTKVETWWDKYRSAIWVYALDSSANLGLDSIVGEMLKKISKQFK